jgi:diguanylate cyclase (GGDEF)-like protein
MSPETPALAALSALLVGAAWRRAERRWRARVAQLERAVAPPHPAGSDALTGVLSTRSLFVVLDAELARARRGGSTLAVVALDLDGFRHVNERSGFAAGDRLLQSVASRIRGELREYDHVGRMGADEFVAVLPGATPDHVDSVSRRLAACVAAACADTGEEAGVSLGSAIFPGDGPDAEQLLVRADAEMFRAKQRKRSVCGR